MKKTYDVLIIGAGPVGLTLANFMAKFGHKVCVLEKQRQLFQTPRAVAVDDESLRIWQEIGLIDEMKPYIEFGDEGDEVLTYLNSSGKKLLGIVQHGKPYGYPKGAVILQHEIDKILLDGLKRFPKHVDVFFDHEVQSFDQTKKSVSVYAQNHNNAVYAEGKYLVACDGGRSIIRKQLDIKMKGFTYPQSWLVVDTIEDRAERKGAEVFCDPGHSIATIPLPKNHRRFEFFLKEKYEPNAMTEADAQKFLDKLKQFKIKKIVRHLVYTFNARIAQRYRDGRIFLAGDACHVTPPFAGQGLATGLRDVANLGWKLSECINNNFSDDLLDTYEQERRPHQKKMIKLAVKLGKFMMPKNRFIAFLHGVLFHIVSKIKFLKKLIELRGQNIQPVYKRGFIGHGKFAGKYFPQPSFMDGKKRKLFDDLLGDKFTIVSFGLSPYDCLSEKEIKYWKSKGAELLTIPVGQWPLFSNFIDVSKRHLFILRPDRMIYGYWKR